MSNKLGRVFDSVGGSGWWIIVLFFLFLVFQDCWAEICITDWIPFLILLLIACSCSGGFENDCCETLDNHYDCNC